MDASVVLDGIASFADRRDFYYGEIPQSAMVQFRRDMGCMNWEAAIHNLCSSIKEPAFFIEYALSETRAGWMFLLPIQRCPRVLDLGCGPGAISIALAQAGCEVTAMDMTLERLQFLRARAEHLGLRNITAVHGGDRKALPFPDGSFDVVILNGVLEWVGTSRQGEPRDAQREFLGEANRVLKEDGHVLIAIENRFSAAYFAGLPEDHTHIKYLSLLPRFLANRIHRQRTGYDYRVYTHSPSGYRKLLSSAGFPDMKLLLPAPDYRKFFAVLDPSQREWIRRFFQRRARGKKALISRFIPDRILGTTCKYFAHSYVLLGNKQAPPCSALDAIVAEVCSRPAPINEYLVTSTGVVVVQAGNVVIKLPLSAAANERCALEQRNLALIRSLADVPEIPVPFRSGMLGGIRYYAETTVPGDPVTGDEALSKATSFLIALSRVLPRPSQTSAYERQKWIQGLLSKLEPLIRREHHKAWGRIVEYLHDNLVDTAIPRLYAHGDYWLGNLLWDGRRITGVVDWDRFGPDESGVNDVLSVLFYGPWRQGHFLDRITQFAVGNGGSSIRLFDDYCNTIGFHVRDRRPLVIAYWLNYVASRLKPHNYYVLDPNWITQTFTGRIEQFADLTARRSSVAVAN
jgi:SAM-dependent methyltransferase